jgi:hypothetical protein
MYENAQYQNAFGEGPVSISVYVNGQQLVVPIDPANTDYANIMALVAAGELTIAPAEGA